jgi:glycosyltransferase involved in cell wall biosynthesis
MLTPVMPSDRGNGLAMRAGFFLDAYSRRFAVDLVVAPIAGRADASPFVHSRVRRLFVLDLARPDSHYVLLASLRDPLARLDAFRRYGRPSLTSFVGAACHALNALADEHHYSVVHVSRLYVVELAQPWIDKRSDRPRLVLDCDDNDAIAYRQMAAMARRAQNPIAAAWAEVEAKAFARFASLWLRKFDRVFAASQKEARSLSTFGVEALTAPNVIAPPCAERLKRHRNVCSVLFVGTLSYAPNADAVTWFVSRIWRRLARALNRRVRLVIVGANPPAAVARLGSQPGIQVTGAVPDIARYYRDADLVVAPLRAGGGTRIKIIEAAAHGVPVVATGFAAEGTAFRHGVDILIANDEKKFVRLCLLLARNRALSVRLASQALATVKREYSPTHWRNRIADLAARCGKGSPIRMPDEELDLGETCSSGQS